MSNDGKPVAVPDGFPRESHVASIAGAQPKLAVIRDSRSGEYVTQQDRAVTAARFDVCENLADQLRDKCIRNRHTKYRHLAEHEILEQFLTQLLRTNWGSDSEMRWTVQRAAEKLGWTWP